MCIQYYILSTFVQITLFNGFVKNVFRSSESVEVNRNFIEKCFIRYRNLNTTKKPKNAVDIFTSSMTNNEYLSTLCWYNVMVVSVIIIFCLIMAGMYLFEFSFLLVIWKETKLLHSSQSPLCRSNIVLFFRISWIWLFSNHHSSSPANSSCSYNTNKRGS